MGADTASQWRQDLLALGLTPGEVVGQGIEGVVVALDDERVAKVWRRHSPVELRGRRAFDEAVAVTALPFAAPRIIDVLEVDGRAVTVEARLHGTPLRGVDESGRLDDTVIGHLVDVLAGLAAAPAPVGAGVLPALPGEAPLAGDFGPALADLVAARTQPYPTERLALYRAAYALLTATVVSASGSDGHFAWCVRMRGRADVREAVRHQR